MKAQPSAGKAARNERRKLEANSINAIGIGALAAGFIQPFAANMSAPDSVVRFACCAMVTFACHAAAQALLRGMED